MNALTSITSTAQGTRSAPSSTSSGSASNAISSKRSGASVGLIVGVAVGCVSVLCLGIALLVRVRRRVKDETSEIRPLHFNADAVSPLSPSSKRPLLSLTDRKAPELLDGVPIIAEGDPIARMVTSGPIQPSIQSARNTSVDAVPARSRGTTHGMRAESLEHSPTLSNEGHGANSEMIALSQRMDFLVTEVGRLRQQQNRDSLALSTVTLPPHYHDL